MEKTVTIEIDPATALDTLKCLLDCLQMTGTIKNDNRCVKIVAEKFIDKANPRIEFEIEEVGI